MNLVLISGLSGSGKSVALRCLEDAGFYCVDNLPVAMLADFILLVEGEKIQKIAVAIDARAGNGLTLLPEKLKEISQKGIAYSFLFLEASDETLVKRYSESRRRHPLDHGTFSLIEAIAAERLLLRPLAAQGQHIDTSHLEAAALRHFVHQFIDHLQDGTAAPVLDGQVKMTLTFQSFGFKHGLPLDADLVFDVRCLPNPHYDPLLRQLTGQDEAVAAFLKKEPAVTAMQEEITGFLRRWLPAYIAEGRHYLTVSVGCTGGQHRSVFLCEQLAEAFNKENEARLRVLVRHRALAHTSSPDSARDNAP